METLQQYSIAETGVRTSGSEVNHASSDHGYTWALRLVDSSTPRQAIEAQDWPITSRQPGVEEAAS
jgi:hypothetical protein